MLIRVGAAAVLCRFLFYKARGEGNRQPGSLDAPGRSQQRDASLDPIEVTGLPYRDKKIAVVVPSHNEEGFIGRVIETVPAFVDHIVAVDDGSTDGTLSVIAESADRRISLVRLPRRTGVGAAVTLGCERALRTGADIVAVMAGDGQMHPGDLFRLLDALVDGRADYAKGNRFLDPAVRSRMPRIRQIGNFLLSFLTRCVTGLPVWDSQCGYTAVTSEVLRLLLDMPVCCGYGYPNKILTNLAVLRRRVVDVPVRCVYGQEVSGISIPHYFFRMLFVLASCWFFRLFRGCVSGPAPGSSSRICLLTSSYPRFEGDIAGSFVRDLCREIAASGPSFDVVSPDGPGSVPLGDDGISVHRITYFLPRCAQRLCYGDGMESNLGRNFLLSLQAPFFFLFFLAGSWRYSRRCGLIWSHWLVPAGLAGAIVSMFSGTPHVVTIHSGGLHLLKRIPFGGSLARFIYRHSRGVTAVSEYSLREFASLIGCGRHEHIRAEVLPMGVRMSAAIGRVERERLREKYGLNGKCAFLYMGRLIRLKGIHNLLCAARRVRNAKLLIAGEGPEKASLERMAAEFGIDAEFYGFLTGRRKQEVLSACDVLVYPSMASPSGRTEGSPVVILESLASGRPVVASAVGGIPEVIKDGLNGYLVPMGDVVSLADTLDTISGSSLRLRELSRGAFESGMRYRLDRIAPAFLRVFQVASA